jgi:hypothetical protein
LTELWTFEDGYLAFTDRQFVWRLYGARLYRKIRYNFKIYRHLPIRQRLPTGKKSVFVLGCVKNRPSWFHCGLLYNWNHGGRFLKNVLIFEIKGGSWFPDPIVGLYWPIRYSFFDCFSPEHSGIDRDRLTATLMTSCNLVHAMTSRHCMY